MSRVWLRIAGTSDATKYSPSPRPITTGGPSRAATILFGSCRLRHGKRKHSAQLLHRAADGALQIAFEILLHQVRDHFGIGLRLEDVALALQLLFQRKVIFDDAVVHHDDVAGAVAMRMGVLFGGASMRRPAGMADAVIAIHRIQAQSVFEIAQFAGCAADAQASRRHNRRRVRPSRSRDIRAASARRE